jgi:hypothetical protein
MKGSTMFIKCSCGHEADYLQFTRTTLAGDLPPGEFQCPACRSAWRRQESGHKLFTAGDSFMVVPEKLTVVSIQARL